MKLSPQVAGWLREPLVHFLLIGAVVYAVLSGRPPDPGERRIVVDEATVVRLVDRWSQAFRRPPTQAEIDGLIRDYVKDEVYYREALRLGLDQGDETVRRLMRNKMIAAATSDAEATVPSDAQLQAVLDKDPARYAKEARFDFAQVYLGKDSAAGRAAAVAALAGLNRGQPGPTGEQIALPARFAAASTSAVASQFGDPFAAALLKLPTGTWAGPVSSGYGLHLVRLDRREAAAPPSLEEIRQRLENDWRADALTAAQDQQYRELLKSYDVVTELKR